MNKKIKGSATVEAAAIMPAVIMFFGAIIWLIDVFRIYSVIGATVNEAGNTMVGVSYAYESFLDGNDSKELVSLLASACWSEIYLRSKINKAECAKHISDLNCFLTDLDADGRIVIRVTYRVSPYIKIPGYPGIVLTNSYYSSLYGGYCIKVSEDKAYITGCSEVYHATRDCTALKRTIKSVLYSEIDGKRNMSGGKYYPCEHCGNGKKAVVVYISPHGNRYHTDVNCSDLNPQIYEIPLSEIGDRRECTYCRKK